MTNKLKQLMKVLFSINANKIESSLGGQMTTSSGSNASSGFISRFLVTRGILVDLLSSLIFFVMTVSLSILVELYTPDQNILYNLRYSGIILVALFLIARRLRIFIVAVIPLHIAFFAAYLYGLYTFTSVFDSAFSIVVYVTISVMNFVYSIICIARPRTGKLKFDGALLALVVNILLFIPISFDASLISQYFNRLFINIFATFIMFFIARQISEFEDGYYHSMRSSTLPVNHIRMQNYKTIGVVVAGSFVAIAGVFIVPIKLINQYLVRLFQSLMDLLISSLPDYVKTTPEKSITIRREEMEIGFDDRGEYQEYLDYIYYIILVILVIVVLAIVIYFIRKLISSLLNNTKDVPETQRSEFITDTIEKLDTHTDSTSHRQNFGKGYERQVRKKFYSAVKHASRHGAEIKPSDSPSELSSSVKAATGKSIDELTREYEEVRYQ